MGDRVQLKIWVRERTKELFEKKLVEWNGQVYGHVSEEGENAILEYIDKDRMARVEERLDSIDARLDEVLSRLDDIEAAHTRRSQTPRGPNTYPRTRSFRTSSRRCSASAGRPSRVMR